MKYLIFSLIILIALLSFCLWYKNREVENMKANEDKNFELKARISGIDNQISGLRQDLSSITKDTVFKNQVHTITNNFTKIYEKINNTDSLDPIIDGLLSGHRQTKVERNY